MARRPLLVLALAPLLAVSGCGATAPATPGEAGAHPLSAAVEATLAAGTARTAISVEVGVQGQTLDVTGEGLVDFAAHAARHVLVLPEELGSGRVEQVAVDGALWLRSPETGDRYVDVAGPLGTELLELLAGGDPLGQLTALGDAEQVRAVGAEDVDGVPTTRYEARVALDTVTGPLGVALAGGGLHDVSVVANVDGDGRLRRVAPALEGDGGDGAAPGLWATLEFREFGLPVDVRPPAPEEVDERFLDGLYEEAVDALGDDTGEGPAPPDLEGIVDGLAVLADELSG